MCTDVSDVSPSSEYYLTSVAPLAEANLPESQRVFKSTTSYTEQNEVETTM